MSLYKCLLIVLCQLYYIYSLLPKTGKFYITKHTDNTCATATIINQVNPTSPCWSTKYDNGIKPTAYDEEILKLTIQLFDTSSCYGTNYKTADITCDDSQCLQNPINLQEYLKCTYLSFPAKANFTFTKYNDNECQYQTGVIVLKGDANCWDLGDTYSISPIQFTNIQDLSYYIYNSKTCTGSVIKPVFNITCNNKCFKSPNQISSEYFRCNYLLSNRLEISYLMSVLFILLLFV